MAEESISASSIREIYQSPAGDRDSETSGLSPEQAVIVRGGLQVYSLDGMLLGQVEEFIIDTTGNLTSFVVNTGNSIGCELRVLMEWIQAVTRERIQLGITAAEARRAGPV